MPKSAHPHVLTAALAMATLLASSAALAQGGGHSGRDPRIRGQLAIELRPGYAIEDVIATLDPANTPSIVRRLDAFGLYIVSFTCPGAEPGDLFDCEDAIVPVLASHPGVREVEDNLSFILPEPGQTQSFFLRQASAAAYSSQYAADRLDLTTAHAWSRGAGVVVAVLDTGVSPHPAFQDRLLPGHNFVDNNDDASDASFGHGTMVAGIASLVAPDAMILPVKVLNNSGVGDTFSIAQGVLYAIDHGAKVINMSVAAPIQSALMDRVLYRASAAGITLVASMSNAPSGSGSAVTVLSPGGYLGLPPGEGGPSVTPVICVAATNSSDLLAPFSDFATFVGLSAPGVDIVGALNSDDAYAAGDGASFASPLVAGTAALVRSRRPWLSSAEVRSVLLATAAPIDGLNPSNVRGMLGAGRVDAGAAMLAVKCAVDFDQNGVLDPDDLSTFIGAFFSDPQPPEADFNGDGAIDPDDLADFIAGFFDPANGC